MFNCTITECHTTCGKCRWAFLKGSMLSSTEHELWSQKTCVLVLTLTLTSFVTLAKDSPSLSFLSFTRQRITSSSNNCMESIIRYPCCLGQDKTVLSSRTQTFLRSSCLIFWQLFYFGFCLWPPILYKSLQPNISVSWDQSWYSPFDSTYYNCV